MIQNNETEKSFNELKGITQAIQAQKERTLTLARKAALNRLQKSLKRAFLELIEN
ncbi:hypothetical protein [Helicobacter pylori]|uniref:hypothetical protein n=1 Tax=Helicobacter pylori TaxID=210 RepID=UPI0013F43724|nr:hypothetical protein [Helicobacter pylori]MCQ2888394.1 hypothetical protein [Helicobacter pylori]MCQ2939091.1 hypothetical protein [Helicobacter pylori]WQX44886.1 hypothetical protein KVK78_06980 [Helicobacter pylori]